MCSSLILFGSNRKLIVTRRHRWLHRRLVAREVDDRKTQRDQGARSQLAGDILSFDHRFDHSFDHGSTNTKGGALSGYKSMGYKPNLCIYIYINIYIYTYTLCICIYIYTHIYIYNYRYITHKP